MERPTVAVPPGAEAVKELPSTTTVPFKRSAPQICEPPPPVPVTTTRRSVVVPSDDWFAYTPYAFEVFDVASTVASTSVMLALPAPELKTPHACADAVALRAD